MRWRYARKTVLGQGRFFANFCRFLLFYGNRDQFFDFDVDTGADFATELHLVCAKKI
jgi:hypothetical protein